MRRGGLSCYLQGTMATLPRTSSLLDKLQLKDVNPGACHGPNAWIADPAGKQLVSYNPTTGEPIAKIAQATPGGLRLSIAYSLPQAAYFSRNRESADRPFPDSLPDATDGLRPARPARIGLAIAFESAPS